jgi:CheY-like chemotaxis protein
MPEAAGSSATLGDPVRSGRRDTLKGVRVLVVEDELLVALTIQEMLAEIGCEPAGIARSVAEALHAIRADATIELAVLDVNLGTERVFPVADELARRGVPFMFATGYGPADLSHLYPGRPVLAKPLRPDRLAHALAAVR